MVTVECQNPLLARDWAVSEFWAGRSAFFNETHVVEQDLQIFDVRALSVLRLKNGVKPRLHACCVAAKPLQLHTARQLLVRQSQHFHSLGVRHESTLDAQTLVSNLLAHHVKAV